MAVDKFVVEFGVKLWIDLDGFFALFGEDDAEWDVFILLLCSFLEKTLWTNDFGIGEFLVPWA